jgi:hypothetical protein
VAINFVGGDSMKRPKERPCWIVWAKTTSGEVVLRAICSKQWLADDYRRNIKFEKNLIAAHVERSIINHLYAGLFTRV